MKLFSKIKKIFKKEKSLTAKEVYDRNFFEQVRLISKDFKK